MNAKKIAITGASGLVGSALVQQLGSVELLTLRRTSPGPIASKESNDPQSEAIPLTSQAVDWDPRSGVVNVQQLENLDAFIHLAGRSINAARWSSAEKRRLRDSRVLATQRLVEQIASLEQKPSVFLSASAVGIYGDCGADWLEESRPASSDFLGQLAADWEAAAAPLESLGLRVVHARFGVVLTPRGGALQKMLPIFRLGLGGRLGAGNQYVSWVSLEDCVRALQFLLACEAAHGALNVVSPKPVTNQQLTNALGKVLGRPVLFPAPGWAMKLALGEMSEALLLSSQRASSQKLQDLGFEFEHPELEQYLRSVM